YQGTSTRQRPTSNIQYVPTAAMLAGDFTQFASPACNGGRQITLRAPFVNYQLSAKHAFFGRYMATQVLAPPGYAGGSDNLLKTDFPGLNDMIHSFTAGE